MSNEEQQLSQETNEGQQQEAPQLSEKEQAAMAKGWRPESEWQGDPDDFVSAKEFLQRQSFFDKIDAQKNAIKQQAEELSELKETLEKFAEHHKNIEQYTRKQVLEELKQRKKQALEEGDADAVVEIDEAIGDFKLKEKTREDEEAAAKLAKAKTPHTGQLHPEYVSWQKENDWYEKDAEMREFADEIGIGYVTRKGGAANTDPQEVLKYITKRVKETFKEKFQNQNRNKAGTVEGSSAPRQGGKEKAPEASEDEMRVARKMAKLMPKLYKSPEDYIKEIRKLDKA